MVEDCNNFLRLMDKLKPYTVEFEEDGTMKPKKYPSDCLVKDQGEERRPIIVITNDDWTFSADHGVQRPRTRIGDIFLRSERQEKDIKISGFLFFFSRLNLDSLSPEKQAEVVKKTRLNVTKAVKMFKYRKNNEGY